MKPKNVFQLMLLTLLLGGGFLQAQEQRTITGVIQDSSGAPIPGATISVRGTSLATLANENGRFEIKVQPKQELEFSSVGYITQIIRVDNQFDLNVTLLPNKDALGEVVVTALGIRKQKRSLGYAATTINAEDLNDVNSPINALTALYGQVPGLNVTGTALGPAGGLNIKIRNALSLNESTNVNPLFVIDGIPMLQWQKTDLNRSTGNGLNDINMDDVASFEILRGAKASVLYGPEGANGVVIITTKSGKKRQGIGVDFGISQSVDKLWVQQEFQNEFGSGFPAAWNNPGVVDAEGFYLKNGKQAYYPTTYNFGPRFDGRNILWYDSVMRPYVAQPNNIRDLYRNGSTSNINAAVQGSNEFGNFRFSYTRKDYKGIFEGYHVNSDNFNFNGDIKITNKIRFKLVSLYSSSKSHNSPTTNQDPLVTYGIPRQLDMNLLKTQVVDPKTQLMWWNVENRVSRFSPNSVIRNQLALGYFWNQWQNDYDNTRIHFTNAATLEFTLAKGLMWQTVAGLDRTEDNGSTKERWSQPQAAGLTGSFSISKGFNQRLYGQSLLMYDGKFNDDIGISAFAGGLLNRISSETISRNTDGGLIQRDFFGFNNSFRTPLSAFSRTYQRLYSGLASLQFIYKDWLYFQFQGRQDLSSTYDPANNKPGYYGGDVSWIFSDALKLPTWVTFGKLRSSFGTSAIEAPVYFANSGFVLSNYNGITTYNPPGSLPPVNFKPERRKEFELGLESRFAQGRIGFEFNYYHRRTFNQPISLTTDPGSGFGSIKINAGVIINKGMEIIISGSPVKTNHFTWDLNLNGSKDKPMIQTLYPGVKEQTLWGMSGAKVVSTEGRPFGEILVRPYNIDPVSGKKIVGADGFYSTDPTQYAVVGKVIPDIGGGFTNTLTYKGLSLNLIINYQFGSTLVSQTNMYMVGNGSGKNTVAGRDERSGGLPYYINNDGKFVRLNSHNDAVPADSKYPFIMHNGVVLDGVKSDGSPNDVIITAEDKYAYFWQSFMDLQPDVIYKNDYIKLRNVSLSYVFPGHISNKVKMQRLIISAFANNLFYLHKTLPNVDTESLNGTNVFYENNAFPTVRTYGLSLRATF